MDAYLDLSKIYLSCLDNLPFWDIKCLIKFIKLLKLIIKYLSTNKFNKIMIKIINIQY